MGVIEVVGAVRVGILAGLSSVHRMIVKEGVWRLCGSIIAS